jgi:hypothetical protein
MTMDLVILYPKRQEDESTRNDAVAQCRVYILQNTPRTKQPKQYKYIYIPPSHLLWILTDKLPKNTFFDKHGRLSTFLMKHRNAFALFGVKSLALGPNPNSLHPIAKKTPSPLRHHSVTIIDTFQESTGATTMCNPPPPPISVKVANHTLGILLNNEIWIYTMRNLKSLILRYKTV